MKYEYVITPVKEGGVFLEVWEGLCVVHTAFFSDVEQAEEFRLKGGL